MFTNQERESLTLVSSRKTFVDMNKCMVCESSSKPVNTMSYLLPHVFDTRSNMLVFCEQCREKAVYVYMRECIAAKKLPTAKPLFNEDCEFTVIRTRGEESLGKMDKRLNLGWSTTANEITVWVSLDDTTTTKPLLLSLLFKANPQLRDLPEFANGLVLRFEYEDMLKAEFPDFFKQVQTSVDKLNDSFFSDRVSN